LEVLVVNWNAVFASDDNDEPALLIATLHKNDVDRLEAAEAAMREFWDIMHSYNNPGSRTYAVVDNLHQPKVANGWQASMEVVLEGVVQVCSLSVDRNDFIYTRSRPSPLGRLPGAPLAIVYWNISTLIYATDADYRFLIRLLGQILRAQNAKP
jgi:hypothetical protein